MMKLRLKPTKPVISTRFVTPVMAGIEVQELCSTKHTRIVSAVVTVRKTVAYVVAKEFKASRFWDGGDLFSFLPLKDFGYEFDSFKSLAESVFKSHEGLCEKTSVTCSAEKHIGYTFDGAPIFKCCTRTWHPFRSRKSGIWDEYKKAVSEREPFAMYPYMEFCFYT